MQHHTTWYIIIIIIIQDYCHHSPIPTIPVTGYATSYNMMHYHHHPTILSSSTNSHHSCDRICNIIQHDTLPSSSNIIVIIHQFSPFLWQDMQHHTTWYFIIIIQQYCHNSPILTIPVTGYATSYNIIHYHHHPSLLSSHNISHHSCDRICNIIQHDTLSSSSNIIVILHQFPPFLWQDMQHHTTWYIIIFI